jgi:hypothetical protein
VKQVINIDDRLTLDQRIATVAGNVDALANTVESILKRWPTEFDADIRFEIEVMRRTLGNLTKRIGRTYL